MKTKKYHMPSLSIAGLFKNCYIALICIYFWVDRKITSVLFLDHKVLKMQI